MCINYSTLFFFRYAPSAKAPLMKKFQKDLNNSTFMYQGRTVTASTRPTEHKKKNVTLKSLGTGKKDDSTGVFSLKIF